MPGYREAAAASVLPAVPAEPPRLLPGPTAQRLFHQFLWRIAAAVGALLLWLRVRGALDLPPLATLLDPLSAILVLGLILRWWRQVGVRNMEELQHGYTTFVMQFGAFQRGERRHWRGAHTRVLWDYSGTWVLDGNGGVITAPDRSADAPGFYPSPNKPGALELWSGLVWTGEYHKARPSAERRAPYRG